MDAHRIWMPVTSRQRGVTLVELMVTIAINLVLVLAATLLYLNTRSTQREVNERSAVYETGQFAMGLLSRDITSAGFYPAAAIERPSSAGLPTDNVRFTFDSAAQGMGVPTAFAHGVFGCAGKGFDPSSGACDSPGDLPAGSDALVLAYFTEDSFSLSSGQRADCTRADVINDTSIAKNDKRATYLTGLDSSSSEGGGDAGENQPGKVKPNEGPLPDAPLLVINAYQLKKDKLVLDDGREVDSATLTCWGNGRGSRQELVQGVEQFVVTYGLMSDDTRRPAQYVGADAVASKSATINGEALVGWQLVSAVRICLMVRSPQATVLKDSPAVTDCKGGTVSRSDGFQVRRFEQVFSLKNRQGNTVGLKLADGSGGAK